MRRVRDLAAENVSQAWSDAIEYHRAVLLTAILSIPFEVLT
jgi:hypothetical protein